MYDYWKFRGFGDMKIYGALLISHPGVLIIMFMSALAVGFLLTEYIFKRAKRSTLQQQMMYERQETVCYRGERERALLRPASLPDNSANELLRSRDDAPHAEAAQMLRASADPLSG